MKRAAAKSIHSYDKHYRKRSKHEKHASQNNPNGKSSIQTFSKLKVNSIDISVGDSVAVRESTAHNQIGYARINTIFKHPISKDPMVNLTWYYTPSDLFKERQGFFGNAELLSSDHA